MLWPILRRLVLAAAALVCGLTLMVSLWTPAELVRTEDQNHDGRPDVWRYYDRHGVLHRVDIDTNFDGRADRRSFYRDGILARTETDRNFDNQVDLIEEFDLLGQEHIRSVVDANFDGTADLLVLFQDGQPVHSEWRTPPHGHDIPVAHTAYTVHLGEETGTLAGLDDPFVADTALRATHRPRAPDSIAVIVPTVMLKGPVAIDDRPGLDVLPLALPRAATPRSTTPHRLPARAPPQPSRQA